VLDGLARAGLQSDRRFSESYIESRVRRGSGPLRIRAELRERGIDDTLIAEGLEAYAGEWRETLRQVHDSKYGADLPSDRKELARRARFLEYRGFPSELIARLLLDDG
jgi:regulatory protein